MMVHDLAGLFMVIEPRPYLLAVLIFLVAAAALVLWWWLISLVLDVLRRRQQITRGFKLTSHSNFETRFYLRADLGGLAKFLKAGWYLNQTPVRPQKIERVSYVEERPAQNASQGGRSNGKTGSVDLKATGKQVKEKARFVRSIASAFASISSALGSLLPKPLNEPFVNLADALRSGQKEVDQAMAKPKAIQASGKQLKSSASQLDKMTGGVGSKVKSGGGVAQAQPEKQLRRVIERDLVIATGTMLPTEEVAVRLVLNPSNPFRDWTGKLTVTSQQLENENFPGSEVVKPQQASEDITLKRLPFGLMIVFSAYVLFILSIIIWAALWVIQWLVGNLNI